MIKFGRLANTLKHGCCVANYEKVERCGCAFWEAFLLLVISFLGVLFTILISKDTSSSPNGILFSPLIVVLLGSGYVIAVKRDRVSLDFFAVFIMGTAILFPPVRFSPSFPAVRLDFLIVVFAWVLFILDRIAQNRSLSVPYNPMYKWFLGVALSISLSMIYVFFVKGYDVTLRDTFELVKLLKYFLIFSFFASVPISPRDIAQYYKILLGLFLLSALFGFAQYLRIKEVIEITYFYAPTQMLGLLRHGRIVGTMGNPNEFGAMMVLASSLAVSGALLVKNRTLKLFSWVCFGVFVLAVLLTLSRSALIALTISIAFITFIGYPRSAGFKKAGARLLFLVPLLLIVVLFLSQFLPHKFFLRVLELGNLNAARSWRLRLEAWKYNFAIWEKSPLFGWGPGKAGMPTIVDNEWLLILRRYGVVGVAIFISWGVAFYSGLSKIAKVARRKGIPEALAIATALQATLVAYAIYMIPAAVYHDIQLMSVLSCVLGLAYSQIKSD